MIQKNCPVCINIAPYRLSKGDIEYYQCSFCKTLFVEGGLPQDNKVGGEHEEGRNVKHKQERVDRFLNLVGIYGSILDFGTGHGMLLDDLTEAGFKCAGYDKFNHKFEVMPEGKYDMVTLIECLEHLSSPFEEFDLIYDKLKDNGVLYLESSFIDVAEEEGIPLEQFHYLSVVNGHCTIFSHSGLDILMDKKGFEPLEHLNRHVRVYIKKQEYGS